MTQTSTLITSSICVSATIAALGVYYWRTADRRLRAKLPHGLQAWRLPGPDWDAEESVWAPFVPILLRHGLERWPSPRGPCSYQRVDSLPIAMGYFFATSSNFESEALWTDARSFSYNNALKRVVRTREGRDLVCRLIVIHDEGHECLKALRRLATGANTLLADNHVLPMVRELHFEDIVCGLFPLTGPSMADSFGPTAYFVKNSVGDIMDMLLQALEALTFIHRKRVAHRDAFHNNFLVEWQPQSMRTKTLPTSRPRVYLIDFETAICFPEDRPYDECLCSGMPFNDLKLCDYAHPYPKMIADDNEYNPFLLDLWQLTFYFQYLKTSFQPLDDLLPVLIRQGTAEKAHEALRYIIGSTPPEALLLEPVFEKETYLN